LVAIGYSSLIDSAFEEKQDQSNSLRAVRKKQTLRYPPRMKIIANGLYESDKYFSYLAKVSLASRSVARTSPIKGQL
jgi:hypothetical protein